MEENKKDQSQVILVDPGDNPTGIMDKLEAHRKGLLHRAISVFIINSKGEWLIQQRAKNKYHSNSLWTNACCTHPYPGENCHDAATRRLAEEIGIRCPLRELFQFTYFEKLDNELSEHEFDHVFLGISDEHPLPNPAEVMDFRYIDFQNLEKDIKKYPQNYTAWFKRIANEVHLQTTKLNLSKQNLF